MGNLSAGEILKYEWRRNLFLEKYEKQDVFELAGGTKVRLLYETDKAKILKKGSNGDLSKLEFIDAKQKTRKYKLTSFKKNVEFGGKPPGQGAGVGIEMREINSINNQFNEIKSKTGEKTVPIKIGDKVYRAAACHKTPGVPKSDFHLTDEQGNEIVWMSHKEGSNPNDFQQWGGMTDSKIANHPEAQSFIQKIQKMFPKGISPATTMAREIKSKDLINYSVYGIDYNKRKIFSRDNVNIVLQGSVRLVKQGKNWIFSSNHTLLNGERLTGGFVPVFMAIYKGDRSNFGVKGARFAIQPKLSRKVTAWV
jgi:hypothetical protein